MTVVVDDCELCIADKGVYEFGRVCCCARFVCSIPMKHLRTGWMEMFKSRKSAQFFAQLEGSVRAHWVDKKITKGIGDGGI